MPNQAVFFCGTGLNIIPFALSLRCSVGCPAPLRGRLEEL